MKDWEMDCIPETEMEMQDFISDAIMEKADDIDIRSFDEAQLLTWDKGLVITFPDGTKYNLTIQKA